MSGGILKTSTNLTTFVLADVIGLTTFSAVDNIAPKVFAKSQISLESLRLVRKSSS